MSRGRRSRACGAILHWTSTQRVFRRSWTCPSGDRASRRAGAECYPPHDELGQQEQCQGTDRDSAREDVVDRVVADAQRTWDSQPDEREAERADDWVPELRDRQAPVPRLHDEQSLRHDDGEKTASDTEQRKDAKYAEPSE